jgi:hypothetical protein
MQKKRLTTPKFVTKIKEETFSGGAYDSHSGSHCGRGQI